MTGIIFGILFGLILLFFPCAGQIIPPENDTFRVLPGENVTIAWKLNVSVSEITVRDWRFLSNTEGFAEILKDGDVDEEHEHSPGPFRIEKPSTLILENVNIQYDGKYRFSIFFKSKLYTSDVTVVVLVKPNVTINCTSPLHQNHRLILSEGENFTCLCEGKGGNPPADVTWRKDGVFEPGGPGKEQKTLTRNIVNDTDNGAYMCVAKSYTLINDRSIEVKVKPFAKPNNTNITIIPKSVMVGKGFEITCYSEGLPDPDFVIMHNGKIASTKKTYNRKAIKSDEGTYTCIASNMLGNDSAIDYLNVTGAIPSTPTATPTPTASTSSGNETVTSTTKPPPSSSSLPIWLIVLIVVIILLILLIIGIVVYRYKMKQKARGSRGNIDPAAGNHYELENEDAGPGDNAYDSVGPVGTSSGKSKPPEKSSLPPVYAAVDKNNRQGNTLYASLDTDAMKPKRESKKEPERTPQTEYASIDFAKRADDGVPKADLV